MPVWLTLVLKEVGALLKKWGAPFLAFMAGRSSVKHAQEKADHKATKKELEAEREAADILSDDDKLERMRDRWKDKE